MNRSLALRAAPTARQTQRLVARLEESLAALGARVERPAHGELRFRSPPPWKAPRLDWLLLISHGRAAVTAGGGPWRVSYHLQFTALRAVIALLTLVLMAVGWQWPRLLLLNVVLTLWLVVFGILYFTAAARFRRLVRTAADEVVERRAAPRPQTAAGTTDSVPPA